MKLLTQTAQPRLAGLNDAILRGVLHRFFFSRAKIRRFEPRLEYFVELLEAEKGDAARAEKGDGAEKGGQKKGTQLDS